MERERAQQLAETMAKALLWAAGALLIIGAVVLWRIAAQVGDRFGFSPNGDEPAFDDYLFALWPYTLGLATAVGVVGGLGLYFRWLAVEQDAKMEEFDMLLDALGVPVESDDDEPTTEVAPDGRDDT